MVALGCAIYPLIAKAQTIPTPPFLTEDDNTALAPTFELVQTVKEPPTVEEMVDKTFPDAPIMYRVARAESSFDPSAKNPNSTAVGVFQILEGTWSAYHCTGSRTNAADNIACARKLYDDSGTTPWNSSKSKWR